MNALESQLVQAALPFAAGLIGREVINLGSKLITFLAKSPKTAALEPVVRVLEDATKAAINAAEDSYSKGPATCALAALKAAEAVVVAEQQNLLDAAEAEAAGLLGTPKTTAVAPGGASVNMPKGYTTSGMRLFLVLATGALVGLLGATADAQVTSNAQVTSDAQIENPPVVDHWEAAILTPALRFNLKGSAPASVAAGSGVAFDYLFAKVMSGKTPVFGISLFAQGGINLNNLAATENGSIGAGVILFNVVTLGMGADLVSGGPGGASGLLTGNVSLANLFPVAFYSVSLAAL